jgi:hypothetical protein
VRAVVAAAVVARVRPRLPARRRALAQALVQGYVPAVRILGLDVRRLIAGRDHSADGCHAVEPARAPGFRRELTRGGQDGEALRHLAAAAACVLLRKPYWRIAAQAVDRVQGILRGRPDEAAAEAAGNRAGADLGRELETYLRGDCTRAALTRRLRAQLCRGGRPAPRASRP